jgi:hypothetical protein
MIENENVAIKQMRFDEIIGLYVFKNSFDDFSPLCKYDILEEYNPSCLLHNLLNMDVIFYIYIIFIIVVP